MPGNGFFYIVRLNITNRTSHHYPLNLLFLALLLACVSLARQLRHDVCRSCLDTSLGREIFSTFLLASIILFQFSITYCFATRCGEWIPQLSVLQI